MESQDEAYLEAHKANNMNHTQENFREKEKKELD